MPEVRLVFERGGGGETEQRDVDVISHVGSLFDSIENHRFEDRNHVWRQIVQVLDHRSFAARRAWISHEIEQRVGQTILVDEQSKKW